MIFASDDEPGPERNPESESRDNKDAPPPGHPSAGGIPFGPTPWTIIVKAPSCSEALGALITRYEPALRAWCRCCFGQDGDDVFQEFITSLLTRPSVLSTVEREKGRGFRYWLKGCLRHEYAGMKRWLEAKKRGGGMMVEPLEPELQNRLQDPRAVDPAVDLDKHFARSLMENAAQQLLNGLAPDSLEQGVARIMFAPDDSPTVRGFIAARGSNSGAYARIKSRLKERYRAILRREIADSLYEPDSPKIEEEIQHLQAALRNA